MRFRPPGMRSWRMTEQPASRYALLSRIARVIASRGSDAAMENIARGLAEHESADAAGGKWVLMIPDLEMARHRPEYVNDTMNGLLMEV